MVLYRTDVSSRFVTKTTYRIVLQSQPQPVDEGARLQRLLKAALRQFGFKFLRVEKIVHVKNAETLAETSPAKPPEA
jgi:hypothetical protein